MTHWKHLQCSYVLIKLRVFMYLFVGHGFFLFSPPDAARRSNIFTNLHRRESCLTVNKIWVFHPGGGSTAILLCPTHLYSFPLVSKMCDSFGPCPITRVHHSVPYTVFLTHNRVPVTPNSVPIPPCTHTHVMRCLRAHAMLLC